MNNDDWVVYVLKSVGAIITNDHFVYNSGRHGTAYVNKDALYPHTRITSLLCRTLAHNFLEYEPEVAVAPALGGIILSQWVAYYLSEYSTHEVLGVYAEKTTARERILGQPFFSFRRGYEKFVSGKRVVVLEDILNTGNSARIVVELCRRHGGNVVALGAICNRGNVGVKDVGDLPRLISLSSFTLESWSAEECANHGPCSQEVPVRTDLGKGKDFLKIKK
jgi:orotate phosphoribosyltransferase